MLLFVDRLTNVDFSLLDAERGLLGETWLAHVRLHGALDEQGMVCDFGIVKRQVRQWLDEQLDHRLVVPAHSPNIELAREGETLDIRWRFGSDGDWLHTRCPASAVALVEAEQLTAQSVARWCTARLKSVFPDSIDRLELSFSGESIDGAQYQYSHGLKKHAGNCQRIAHGHRSRLGVWLDGQRCPALEARWAERWHDIYIGTRADVRDTRQENGKPYHHFAYRAEQGAFELTLPAERCYLIDSDSTVECIAKHIAGELARENPGHKLTVKAYEGTGKGAIAQMRG